MSEADELGKKDVRKVLAEEKINPNHRGRGLSAAEKKRIYADYYKRKRIVFEAESRNNQYLVLFLASDGKIPGKEKKFYRMGGNSAIIYAYDIAPMIGRRQAEIKPDFDLGDCKFRRGMVSIGDLPLLTTLLEQKNIKRVERENDNDDVVYFKLNRVYSDDDIKALLEMHRNEREELNKIVYANVVFPDVHSKLLTLKTMTYRKVMKLDRSDRAVLQDRLLDPVLNLSAIYSQMAHNDLDVHEAAMRMMGEIDIFFDRLSFISELDLIEISSIVRLGKTATELKLLVKGKMLNYVPKEERAEEVEEKPVEKVVRKRSTKKQTEDGKTK